MRNLSVSGIYKIQSRDGKVYIGSTINMSKRWKEHENALRANKHVNMKLQAAWNKYGAEYFTFSAIEIVEDVNKLLYYEQLWINIAFSSLDRGDVYNLLPTAGSHLGMKRSEETKAKMRKPKSLEARAKMSEAAKRRGLSPERQKRMAESRKGKTRSLETRKRQSESGVKAWQKRKLYL